MLYQVIVCPDEYCRGVSIIKKDDSETTLCSKCNSQYKLDRYKVSFESESRENAVAARTKLLMKLNDDDMSFEEIKKKGYLEEPDRVFSKSRDKDTRTIKEIVRDNLRDIEEPTEEKVIEASIKAEKVDREKAQKAIKALVRDGEVIDYGSYLRLL